MGEASGSGLPTPDGVGDCLERGCGVANFSCGARCSADGAPGSTLGARRTPELCCPGVSSVLSLRARSNSPALTARSLVWSARRCWRCAALRTRTSCAIPRIFSGAAHRATPGMALDAGQGSAIKSNATTKNGALPMRNAFQSTSAMQVNLRTRTRVPRGATASDGICSVRNHQFLGDPAAAWKNRTSRSRDGQCVAAYPARVPSTCDHLHEARRRLQPPPSTRPPYQ